LIGDGEQKKGSHLSHVLDKLASLDEETKKRLEEVKHISAPDENKNTFIFNDKRNAK